MQRSMGRALAMAAMFGVFFASLLIAVTGYRSLASDVLASLALAIIACLTVLRIPKPLPKIDPQTLRPGDRTAAISAMAAWFIGAMSLVLIYKGRVSEHQQIVAIGSCVMTALGGALFLAEQMGKRRQQPK